MRQRAISEISRMKFFPPISIPSELERARRTEMLYGSPLVTWSLTFYEKEHHKRKLFVNWTEYRMSNTKYAILKINKLQLIFEEENLSITVYICLRLLPTVYPNLFVEMDRLFWLFVPKFSLVRTHTPTTYYEYM
jgi:hypothetical protein